MNTEERKEHFDKIIKDLNKKRKPLRYRIIYPIFGLLLLTGGLGLLWYEFGWKMFIAIFIIIWGNNIQNKINNKT